MEQRDTGAGFLAGLLIGGAIGAGLALVLAPRSGEETRELFLERGEDLRHKGEEIASKAREAVTHKADDIRGAFEEGRQAAGGPPAQS